MDYNGHHSNGFYAVFLEKRFSSIHFFIIVQVGLGLIYVSDQIHSCLVQPSRNIIFYNNMTRWDLQIQLTHDEGEIFRAIIQHIQSKTDSDSDPELSSYLSSFSFFHTNTDSLIITPKLEAQRV